MVGVSTSEPGGQYPGTIVNTRTRSTRESLAFARSGTEVDRPVGGGAGGRVGLPGQADLDRRP